MLYSIGFGPLQLHICLGHIPSAILQASQSLGGRVPNDGAGKDSELIRISVLRDVPTV